jgi:hypothetical protein
MVEKSSTVGRTDGVIIPTIIAAHIAKRAGKADKAVPLPPSIVPVNMPMPGIAIAGSADMPGIPATCTT